MVDLATVKLGALEEPLDPRTIRFGAHMSAMPAPPTIVPVPSVPVWGTMLNTVLSDCVPASVGHFTQAVTCLAFGQPWTPADSEIVAAYEDPRVCGYRPSGPATYDSNATDRGSSPLGMMQYWQDPGLALHKIGAYGTVDITNATHIKQAVAYLGGALFAVLLPNSAKVMGTAWDVPPGQPLTGDWAPGSWGGHQVACVGYDTDSYKVISWGEVFTVTQAFLEAYGMVVYVCVDPDALVPASGKTPAGLDIAGLTADLAEVTGHAPPFPAPTPQPSPTPPPVVTTARVMYDAVDTAALPYGGDFYAGYIDGLYANVDAIQRRFPGKRVVRIAVFASTHDGDVLDVETGDATPAQVPGWLTVRRNAGTWPSIYCNLSNHQQIIDAVNAAGLTQPPYWVAHYTEIPHLEAGSVATQWHNGSGYDTSQVAAYWPGIDPAPPAPVPAPPTTWEVDVQLTRTPVHIALGPDGNGWGIVNVPFVKVISVLMNGADPRVAGYVHVPVPSEDDQGGNTQIEVQGGPANGAVDVFVWSAA